MFMAILLGFSLMTLVHSISFGALEAVNTKAARYFSGHISITGYNREKKGQELTNAEEIIDVVSKGNFPIRTISPRTVYYKTDATLFFAGESVLQRRLVGIDLEKEKGEMSSLDFREGSLDDMIEGGEKGILISEAAADLLGAKLGDDIMLYMTTDSGQYNTATMYVKGIFRETSLFGYVAYMRQEDLNNLLGRDKNYATDIAVYTENGVDDLAFVHVLREYLSDSFAVFPFMETKDDLYDELKRVNWDGGTILALLTLDAHLDDITTIMDAVMLVTWFVQILFMLIIMVGILNTYRVLVFERTREIGTLRAMGMTRNEVRLMFLLEAFFLDIAASVAGFFTYILLNKIVGNINLSFLPGAGLFTEGGFLIPQINPQMAFFTTLMMLFAVLIAAAGPADGASKMSPVEAFRVDN